MRLLFLSLAAWSLLTTNNETHCASVGSEAHQHGVWVPIKGCWAISKWRVIGWVCFVFLFGLRGQKRNDTKTQLHSGFHVQVAVFYPTVGIQLTGCLLCACVQRNAWSAESGGRYLLFTCLRTFDGLQCATASLWLFAKFSWIASLDLSSIAKHVISIQSDLKEIAICWHWAPLGYLSPAAPDFSCMPKWSELTGL